LPDWLDRARRVVDARWRRPLRVVIDARMVDGISGGVQQWIIGVASALSRLEGGTEEYLFLTSTGHAGWLLPYLAGPCRVFKAAPQRPRAAAGHGAATAAPATAGPAAFPGATAAPAAHAPATAAPATRAPVPRSRGRRLLRRAVRRVRRLMRRRRPPPPVQWLSSADKLLREAGVDVMHFPRQSAFETSVPSIYQPWDLQHLHLPEFFTPEARARRDTTYRAYCAQAEHIVVATRWVKEDLAAQYDIDPGCITVVNPPPVTLAYVPPRPEDVDAIANRLGLPDRFAYYPAQTWGHKNHERLLEALGELRRAGLDVPLVCSGHPNERDAAVLDRATELGLGGLVTMLGFLTTEEIQVVYERATMLVFPSLYEGWGLPILEAFAAGLPVACSTATSLPELVGDAAVVFDPTDAGAIAAAIRRIWLETPLRAELSTRGRARLGAFDWDRTARVLRALYRQVGRRPLSRDERELLQATPPV